MKTMKLFHHAAPQTNILTLTTGGHHHIMFDKHDSTSLVPIKLVLDYIYDRLDPADDESSSLCSQRPKLHESLLFDHRSIEGCTTRSASSRTTNHLCSPRYNFTPVRHGATRHVNRFEPKIAPCYTSISAAASSVPHNSWEPVEQPQNLRPNRRVAWADLTVYTAEGVPSQKVLPADRPEVLSSPAHRRRRRTPDGPGRTPISAPLLSTYRVREQEGATKEEGAPPLDDDRTERCTDDDGTTRDTAARAPATRSSSPERRAVPSPDPSDPSSPSSGKDRRTIFPKYWESVKKNGRSCRSMCTDNNVQKKVRFLPIVEVCNL